MRFINFLYYSYKKLFIHYKKLFAQFFYIIHIKNASCHNFSINTYKNYITESTMNLLNMTQEIILEHNKRKDNF